MLNYYSMLQANIFVKKVTFEFLQLPQYIWLLVYWLLVDLTAKSLNYRF